MHSQVLFFVLIFFETFLLPSQALTPATTPEQIITSQLTALQQNDMDGVYQYASPRNKQNAGNVERFGQMVRSGPYQHLIGHQRADILLSSKMAASQQYLVRVVPQQFPSSTAVVEYWWSLSRCPSGPNAGCYMVDAVVPNA